MTGDRNTNKKIAMISYLTCIIFVIGVLEPSVESIKLSTPDIKSTEHEGLLDITLKDDALHKTYKIFHIETWYFDALFSNNYSMAICITVLQKGSFNVAKVELALYENTNWKFHKRKPVLYWNLTVSEESPLLKIDNKSIVTGYIDNGTNEWIYNVTFATDNESVDLHYVSTTKGWKIDIRGGWWLAIPRLNVTGTISLNGKNITVSGEGYHDHNWFYTFTPLIQKGWHFGRIAGDTLCLTWAKVRKKRFKGDKIAILNQGQADPVLIDPNDFKLTITKYMCDHLRRIPKKFSVSINNERLTIDAKMEALNTQYVRLPLINYWRYHVRTVGKITLDGLTENIDTVEISEFMKFF